MKKILFFFFSVMGLMFLSERDYLREDVGFVGVKIWRLGLYDLPQGDLILKLSALQTVDVLARTNLGKEVWYQVSVMSSDNETTVRGWVNASGLFCEKDFRVVKKIPPWFLFVEYSDGQKIVCQVLESGRVRFYDGKEVSEETLKVYDSIFLVGKVMLYYDGTNSYVPWMRRLDIITNASLFPHEEDLRRGVGNVYILTGDRVNLRVLPSTNATVKKQLNKGQEVIFLWRVGKREKIAGKWGYWARVIVPEKKGVEGYVFDAYLEEKRVP
ncbi:SH3 domain-containing protein [Thermospira aquatica]|uniref:SH3 domain-containing protein n=1 Tax=Thermospira aquatica TaxID=2828656 RepID=A0AAX3BAA6_9SPIR|nr:SH3 domain-containing protein [Thermospira aquatica]URA09202.1 SH3 domain-containing protein [Thermospira aquatica]